jgi:membrane protein
MHWMLRILLGRPAATKDRKAARRGAARKTRMPGILGVFWSAIRAFFADSVPRLGASLSYYTLFAIGPIIVISIAVAGAVFGPDAVRGEMVRQIDQLVGRDAAQGVQSLLAAANRDKSGGILATVLGFLTLIVASTGAFLELQTSLNSIWRVKPKPGFNIKEFFFNRLRSFGLVVGIGFLLLVSLVLSAALAAFGRWLGGLGGVAILWRALEIIVSMGVITTLFASLYKFLPDVKLKWGDVWVGGFVTALLFTIGKTAIGLYIGNSGTASAYGAAGSVVVLLIWVYYSAQILLLGAEFTRQWTIRNGERPAPEPYAAKQTGVAEKVPGGAVEASSAKA